MSSGFGIALQAIARRRRRRLSVNAPAPLRVLGLQHDDLHAELLRHRRPRASCCRPRRPAPWPSGRTCRTRTRRPCRSGLSGAAVAPEATPTKAVAISGPFGSTIATRSLRPMPKPLSERDGLLDQRAQAAIAQRHGAGRGDAPARHRRLPTSAGEGSSFWTWCSSRIGCCRSRQVGAMRSRPCWSDSVLLEQLDQRIDGVEMRRRHVRRCGRARSPSRSAHRPRPRGRPRRPAASRSCARRPLRRRRCAFRSGCGSGCRALRRPPAPRASCRRRARA